MKERKEDYIKFQLEQSDDLIKEHSYLIARRVRPLALIGTCKADSVLMLKIATKLEYLAEPAVIPFVIDTGHEYAYYGYASASWVVDLFEWIVKNGNRIIPSKHRERIIGLLCGYSTEALRLFEEENSVRAFNPPI